jgi:hypothetical protein
MPLNLSDPELSVLMAVAAPIAPRERDGFLRSVAAELASYPPAQIGPGLVHQIAVRHQRQFLGPPPRDAA